MRKLIVIVSFLLMPLAPSVALAHAFLDHATPLQKPSF